MLITASLTQYTCATVTSHRRIGVKQGQTEIRKSENCTLTEKEKSENFFFVAKSIEKKTCKTQIKCSIQSTSSFVFEQPTLPKNYTLRQLLANF